MRFLEEVTELPRAGVEVLQDSQNLSGDGMEVVHIPFPAGSKRVFLQGYIYFPDVGVNISYRTYRTVGYTGVGGLQNSQKYRVLVIPN